MLKFIVSFGWVVAGAFITAACTSPRAEPPFAASSAASGDIDREGVARLLRSAPGSSFHLGTQDPNNASRFQIERKTLASAHTEGNLRYSSVAAHDLNYASGGTGKTARLHIYASGGTQQFTWKNQKGYLSNSADIRNQEFTAYVRVRGITDPKRAAISLKVRGGAHTEKNPDLAACTMMSLQAASTGAVARFGKELTHPIYDYVRLTPRFDAALIADRWVGLKLVSFAVPNQPLRIVNRLYLDPEPFDESGRLLNHWRLFAEYIDEEGKSTGKYSKLVDWGGWQTTLRTDGVAHLDFALLSLREVVPPKE